MIPFARLTARIRHLLRDRITEAATTPGPYEQAISDALRAEAELYEQGWPARAERLAEYSGDHPHCPRCIVGWDPRGDRCGLIVPCPDYPACSPPRGRHRLRLVTDTVKETAE